MGLFKSLKWFFKNLVNQIIFHADSNGINFILKFRYNDNPLNY